MGGLLLEGDAKAGGSQERMGGLLLDVTVTAGQDEKSTPVPPSWLAP